MNTPTWYIDKKVIILNVTEDLEFDDLSKIDKQIIQMLEAGDAPIHIIHQSEYVKTPTNIVKVSKELNFLKHENCGWIITINKNPAISFIGRVVTNLSKVNLKSVKTLEEAHKALAKIDQSLVASTE